MGPTAQFGSSHTMYVSLVKLLGADELYARCLPGQRWLTRKQAFSRRMIGPFIAVLSSFIVINVGDIVASVSTWSSLVS